jgi:o-succinylbenzoate---CoA ligase
MQTLDYLKQRTNDDWLIGYDTHQFNRSVEQLYSELTDLSHSGIPKVLLAEREPMKFLAGFIAACAAGCPVFLGNPNWVKQEWEQVFKIVQPNLILGHGDWGSAVRNYYPSQTPIIKSGIMIPTGGSSGKIRFTIHTWETLIASVQGFQQYFQLQQINSFCVLPLYHVSGLMQFLRSFTTNSKLVIQPFKELEPIEKSNIDLSEFFISLVPTQLQRLLQTPISAAWLSKFKTVLLGGAPAWNELLQQARYNAIPLALTYGMTETASQIATLKPEDFIKGYNNCGQVLPHAKVTIHSSGGELLGTNQIGIINIQAQSLALGYYPEFKQDNFQLDDLGFFDNQGYLNIVGRSSNKIITGGENVYPDEVEAAIRATQLVNDVCVIGISDRNWGQAVTALYVPSNSSVTTTALQTTIENKLSKFKHPKYWLSLPNLPRNPQGKINREQLRQIATAHIQLLLK